MIVLHNNGGLGNQLFNYAAARSLADGHRVCLTVDASAYADAWGNPARPHLLHHFPIRASFRHLGAEMDRPPLWARVARRLREDLLSVEYLRGEGEFAYFPEFQRLGRRTILRGHFIGQRFFAGNEDAIRRDLTLDDRILDGDPAARELLARIRAAPLAVGVHVRRGDLLLPAHSWLLLPNIESYYRRAMATFGGPQSEATFWIFSDDPDWCREQLCDGQSATQVIDLPAPATAKILREFYLLSQCHSFIVANSAFSWWAAWLGRHPSKRVIAPDRWDCDRRIAVGDMLPPEWEQLAF